MLTVSYINTRLVKNKMGCAFLSLAMALVIFYAVAGLFGVGALILALVLAWILDDY